MDLDKKTEHQVYIMFFAFTFGNHWGGLVLEGPGSHLVQPNAPKSDNDQKKQKYFFFVPDITLLRSTL